jgi:hypothetical protein
MNHVLAAVERNIKNVALPDKSLNKKAVKKIL